MSLRGILIPFLWGCNNVDYSEYGNANPSIPTVGNNAVESHMYALMTTNRGTIKLELEFERTPMMDLLFSAEDYDGIRLLD